MNHRMYLLAIALSVSAHGQEALSTIPVLKEDQQLITESTPEKQQINVLNQVVSAQTKSIEFLSKELARVKACYNAKVPIDECGALTPDGKSIGLIQKTTPPKKKE